MPGHFKGAGVASNCKYQIQCVFDNPASYFSSGKARDAYSCLRMPRRHLTMSPVGSTWSL